MSQAPSPTTNAVVTPRSASAAAVVSADVSTSATDAATPHRSPDARRPPPASATSCSSRRPPAFGIAKASTVAEARATGCVAAVQDPVEVQQERVVRSRSSSARRRRRAPADRAPSRPRSPSLRRCYTGRDATRCPLPRPAIRPGLAGPLRTADAPPYDVISEPGRDRYRAASPFNVVHRRSGRGPEDPDDPDNRYARAGQLLASWEASGVLVAIGSRLGTTHTSCHAGSSRPAAPFAGSSWRWSSSPGAAR